MALDSATIASLASGAIVLRDFVTVKGKTLGGTAKTFCYWTGEDDITVGMIPAGATQTENRNAIGGVLKSIPDIVDAIGLEARSVTFGFDHLDVTTDSPTDMIYGHNVRVARIEMHRGLFDPATWNLVSAPYLMLAGRIDGAEVDDAAAGSEGGLTIDAMNDVIDLTKTNPAMESDAQQKLRGGDRFRRYGDTAAQIERFWGMEKE